MSKINFSKNYIQSRFKHIEQIDARTKLGEFKKKLYNQIKNFNEVDRNSILNDLYYLEMECIHIKLGRNNNYKYINNGITYS